MSYAKTQSKQSAGAKDILHIYASLGDMKLVDYKNSLAIAALIQLLQEKGIFTESEFQRAALELDTLALPGTADSQPVIQPVTPELHP